MLEIPEDIIDAVFAAEPYLVVLVELAGQISRDGIIGSRAHPISRIEVIAGGETGPEVILRQLVVIFMNGAVINAVGVFGIPGPLVPVSVEKMLGRLLAFGMEMAVGERQDIALAEVIISFETPEISLGAGNTEPIEIEIIGAVIDIPMGIELFPFPMITAGGGEFQIGRRLDIKLPGLDHLFGFIMRQVAAVMDILAGYKERGALFFQERHRTGKVISCRRVLGALEIIKGSLFDIERSRVAVIETHLAGKVLGAFFGHGVDHTGKSFAVFRGESAGGQVNFFQSVRHDADSGASHKGILHRETVIIV